MRNPNKLRNKKSENGINSYISFANSSGYYQSSIYGTNCAIVLNLIQTAVRRSFHPTDVIAQ